MADDTTTPTPEPTPAEADADFAAAFADRAEGKEAESEAGQPASSTDEGAAAPSDDQADKTADRGSHAPENQPNQSADEGFNPFAGLTPEQEAHFRRLEQSEKSNRGRVGGLTAKINRLSQFQKPTAEDQDDQGGETAKELQAKVAKAAEDYPDAAGPLAEMLETLKRQVDSLAGTVKPIADARSEEELGAAYDVLAEKHPDFTTFMEQGSANRQKLAAWAEHQRPSVQQLLVSLDPEDVGLALTLFKTETGVSSAEPRPNGGGEVKDPKRDRQLDALKDTPSGGVPAAAGVPNDFGAAFSARSKQIAAAKTA